MENDTHKNDNDAESYLDKIETQAGRTALVKNQQGFQIPVDSYQYAVNALGFIPISDMKKEKALDAIALHYADKIKTRGIDTFKNEDRLFAISFVDEIRTKRNEASAKFFNDNIGNTATRHLMVTDPSHSELTNAYYYYLKAENTKDTHNYLQGPEAMALVKDKMTKQILEHSPESFQPMSNILEHELSH